MQELPNKLSDLILLAIADLERCEADPRYAINMTAWHFMDFSEDICYVCLAGAVAAKSLNLEISEQIHKYPNDILRKLHAIDSLRAAHIGRAMREFYGYPKDDDDERWERWIGCVRTMRDISPHIIDYDVATKGLALKKHMQKLAKILAQYGF